MASADWLPFVLGAGGVAFIGAVVQAFNAVRDSAEQREGHAIANLERWADKCQADLAFERLLSTHWQQVAATMEAALRRHGIEVPHHDPPPRRGPDNSIPRQ